MTTRRKPPKKFPMPTLEERNAYEFWAEKVLPLELARLRRQARTRTWWWIASRLGWLALYALLTAAFLRALR